MNLSVPSLVQFDEFPAPGGQPSHGTYVQDVLKRSLGKPATVQEGEVHLHGVDIGSIEHGKSVDDYVESSFLTPEHETTDQLRQLARQGGRYVIGQSQGASDSRVVECLWNKANDKNDPQFRQALAGQLGVNPGDDKAVLSALVKRVEHDHQSDPKIHQAHQELVAASDRLPNSVRVVSAGNNGALARTLEQDHIPVDADFFQSELTDSRTIIVGAADTSGAKPKPADFASPSAGAMLAANGHAVPSTVPGHAGANDGSSFAQPQVTAVVFKLLNQHPELSRDEVLRRLQQSCQPVPGAESELGAGVLP